MAADRLEEFLAVTKELKITCTVEGTLGKQRVKNKSDDVSKGKHKVKGYQVEDLEDGECTELVSSGSYGSQQHNPSQARRKTLHDTRKFGNFLNDSKSFRPCCHGRSPWQTCTKGNYVCVRLSTSALCFFTIITVVPLKTIE